ncbi:MAG: hypothetical protein V1844_16100 [Pseudomonadota bacterium]
MSVHLPYEPGDYGLLQVFGLPFPLSVLILMSSKIYSHLKKALSDPQCLAVKAFLKACMNIYISPTLPNAITFDFIRLDGVSLSKACHFGKDVIEETDISDYNTFNNSQKKTDYGWRTFFADAFVGRTCYCPDRFWAGKTS